MSKINVPFIESRGYECGQACVAMMIKYFRPDFAPDFDEMNKVVHHKKGKYTFPPQMGLLLDYYGISAGVFSADPLTTSNEDPDYWQRSFGKDWESNKKYIDIETTDWMTLEVRKKNLYHLTTTKFPQLLSLFQKGYLVCIPVDWNTITGEGGPYSGHFMIITGIEGDTLLLHDPDVGPHIRYPKQLIQRAWEHPAVTDDYFVAYGNK